MKKQILSILEGFNSHVVKNIGNYTQFTIDYLEEAEQILNDGYEQEGNLGAVDLVNYLNAIIYDIGNVIGIAKEGVDKKLFEDLQGKLNKILNPHISTQC